MKIEFNEQILNLFS